jgi:hypothetical protein
MESSAETFWQELRTEFTRIGLDPRRCPATGANTDALPRILARARDLPVGATWRDVFPDFPSAWDPEDPTTWRMPYRPVGDYDYPEWPTGPLVVLALPRSADDASLQLLVSRAREAGHRIYGFALRRPINPDYPVNHADIVLERGTSEQALCEFTAWIELQPPAEVAAIPRLGDEGPTEPRSYHAT